jgi:hypothetical protein
MRLVCVDRLKDSTRWRGVLECVCSACIHLVLSVWISCVYLESSW